MPRHQAKKGRTMLKHHLLKLVIGLAIILTLLGGVALGTGATMAKVAPTHHQMACAAPLPPCW
jgi:hypothetical protein